MDEITAKERILKSIREALADCPIENPYPALELEEAVYSQEEGYLDTIFAENFVKNGGKLVYCENVEVAVQSLQLLGNQGDWSNNIFCSEEEIGLLLEAAGISYSSKPEDVVVKRIGCCSCICLLAQTGSIMFDATAVGRRLYIGADIMIFFATMEQIVQDFGAALKVLKTDYNLSSSLTVWTGLSQSYDIDGGMRQGMGPERLVLFLIDQMEDTNIESN